MTNVVAAIITQNNTYLMYKLGWKGINIDLNPLSIELFKF